MIIFNTKGIEIVRCHAATSTIHKLKGRRREDRGKGESVFLLIRRFILRESPATSPFLLFFFQLVVNKYVVKSQRVENSLETCDITLSKTILKLN